MLDVDDTVLPVRSLRKEQVGYTYRRCQGLSVQLVTASRAGSRPVILGQQLRAGTASGKPGGAAGLVADALAVATAAFAVDPTAIVLRGDSAYYSAELVAAVHAVGGYVSVGIKKFVNVTALIDGIDPDRWEGIDYPGAVWDRDARRWESDAEVAEVPFVGFSSNSRPASDQVPGRLIIRRVKITEPGTLMPVYRHHAFFTTLPDSYSTVEADRIHRGHAIIEQVNADLKGSTLAHLPTTSFAGNSAWVHLAAMAYNLLHAAAALTTSLVNCTSASIRYKLVNVAARLTRSGRHLTLHLPARWPWATARTELSTALRSPPAVPFA
ncbi:transposase [Gordonia neofelifaecis NRRL B-59395]|uniref:Transposase n=2 Tax=Gordonia TaxID=2053 RepID=F1YQ31_9ACTN|nr:transposase [Gordonia neofelifaecis NRRL B-59395]